MVAKRFPLHKLPAQGREADPDAAPPDFIRQDGFGTELKRAAYRTFPYSNHH